MTSPPPEVAWCPLSAPECGPINLLHMELLHHFEQHTMHTLNFQEVWPRMLQLAFQVRPSHCPFSSSCIPTNQSLRAGTNIFSS